MDFEQINKKAKEALVINTSLQERAEFELELLKEARDLIQEDISNGVPVRQEAKNKIALADKLMDQDSKRILYVKGMIAKLEDEIKKEDMEGEEWKLGG